MSSTAVRTAASSTADVKFSAMVVFFGWISKSKSSALKRSKFRKFIDHYCHPSDYFAAVRLILPSLDRERGSYGLKESVLALSLIDALAMSRDSDDAKKLINWRKGGTKTAGHLAGNFSAVAADVLQRRQNSVSAGVTIGELNSLLDRLAAAEDRQGKSAVLGELIRRTNWQEMKWIIMIILKDLKLGISEKTIFLEFHPDAEDLFNVTCDLRFVCEKLCDRNVRHKRQDIEVSKAVRPQLAARVSNCAAAWKKLHGKEVVAECKFDGDRIQVHKIDDAVNYFSRNFIDHDEYVHGMNEFVINNVVADRCILDGEMLVWDKASNRFADFGANQEAAKAAREGLDSERHLCYVAFDLLYVNDTSVIHQSLKERQELLRKFVKPVKGRLEILLPTGNDSLNAHRHPGEPCWSIVANSVDEVERFFKETIENRDEGIVLKDLGSKWEPGDRSGKWLKVKPDYVRSGADLDVLIIGGYYGSGRRGGEIAQFLVGLAERTSPSTYPRKFISFCRVGTGLSDEESHDLVSKLKLYFRKNEYPKKSAPSFYQVTNHAKERPDVWVESPEKSFIVSITSDIRTISSEVFAAPFSLRFPRIDRVRYDKPWHECLDVQSFVELVQSSNGTIQRGTGDGDDEGVAGGKPKRSRTAKGEGRKKLSLTVPSHFARTDVSTVKGETRIFSGMVIHFVNVPFDRSLDSLHKLVVENGGTFSMNLNDTVTHCVGSQSRGIKYEAAKRRGRDVIHYSWVVDCCSRKQLLPMRPNYFIFLSDSSKKKLREEFDEFSDTYFWNINVAELKQVFCSLKKSVDAKSVDYYKKKYCPHEKWCRFHGCRIYFHLVLKLLAADWEVFWRVAMRRMKVEVSVGGGKVVDNPSQATHIVVMSVPGYQLNFDTIVNSFPDGKKHLLRRKRTLVVGFQWLEECVTEGKKLQEAAYSLKPEDLEESASAEEEDENAMNIEMQPASSAHEEPVPSKAPEVVPLIRESIRKRGRSAGTTTKKGKAVVSKPPRPKRARVGKRPAKLQDIASEDENSEQEFSKEEQMSPLLDLDDHVALDTASEEKFQEDAAAGTTTRKGKATVSKPSRPRRARVGKRPVKLQEVASEDELVADDHATQESDPVNEHSEQGPLSGTSEKNKEYMEAERHQRFEIGSQSFDGAGTDARTDTETENFRPRKLEVMVDPVRSVVLDMAPSLRVEPEASNPLIEQKILPPLPPKEGMSSDAPKGELMKKEKVSYREYFDQLLKDSKKM